MNPTEENTSKMSTEDALETLMKDLPQPVQNFILSDERGAVARELAAKYRLHVDQAGEFEQAYLHMLLGVSSPEEFASTLRKVGLSQDVINGLATDVNTRVFMRLRDAQRTATQVPVAKPPPLPPPALDYQPPMLPGSPVPAPMPVPTLALEPTPVPTPLSAPTVSQSMQQHVVHTIPTAAHPPGWHPAAAVHIFVPTHQAPAAFPAQHEVAQAPVQHVPVSATPITQPVVSFMPSPVPTPSLEQSQIMHVNKDPYREPL